jgi:N-acetyl sugar amidotransferase|tara:strand:+ start:110 stop:1315 length:1206 start_codon:yes stop_codon:yes gene_type:complete
MAVKTYYGLPEEVKFCSRCVMSNQRPVSEIEFKHTIKTKKRTLNLNEENVCDACLNTEKKENINWKKREEELYELLDKYRSKDGSYDCIVPGSGGKDSAYQAHILKYKYKMNPLTITWPPILYTEYGYENWKNWINSGFDNLTFTPNGKIMKLLTKLSIENLFHPFQTFMLGQKNLAPKIAANYGIPLIFYGENEAEYGNPIADNNSSLRDKSYFSYENIDKLSLGGVSIQYLKEKYDLTEKELEIFLPIKSTELSKKEINVHYLGYYLKWIPQEAYYYAVENTDFKARPFRTEGTYSKYISIDDKIDDFHYYTTFIKFGIGRTTYDASQEIRNNHITREEAVALVKKFDGEFPERYFQEIMTYLDINPDYFRNELTDKFRSPHLWRKNTAGEWELKHKVY